MTPDTRKNLLVAVTILIVIALCVIFPRVRGFAGLAAREIRYLWWLILLAGIGIYLAFFFGKKKK